jgi:hypothetical protein
MKVSNSTIFSAGGRAANAGGAEPDVWMTYGELLELLKQFSPEDLKQPIQVFESGNAENTVALFGVYAVNTVDHWSRDIENGAVIEKFRSVLDNEHHPEHIVMLIDVCPFSEEGDTHYTLTDEGWVGNKSGKIKR